MPSAEASAATSVVDHVTPDPRRFFTLLDLPEELHRTLRLAGLVAAAANTRVPLCYFYNPGRVSIWNTLLPV
jgi:hypothetical protein